MPWCLDCSLISGLGALIQLSCGFHQPATVCLLSEFLFLEGPVNGVQIMAFAVLARTFLT